MNIQVVLWTVIVLFAIAAAGGLFMAGVRTFSNRNPPAWLAMLHGLLAAAGLTLMLFAAFTTDISTQAVWALVLLVLAALCGLFLNLGYQETRKLLPKPAMYVHAAIVVIGFILLDRRGRRLTVSAGSEAVCGSGTWSWWWLPARVASQPSRATCKSGWVAAEW